VKNSSKNGSRNDFNNHDQAGPIACGSSPIGKPPPEIVGIVVGSTVRVIFVVTRTVLGVHTLPLGPCALDAELPTLVLPPAVLLILPIPLVTPDVGAGVLGMDWGGTEAEAPALVPLLIVELATLVPAAKKTSAGCHHGSQLRSRNVHTRSSRSRRALLNRGISQT